MPSLYLTQPGSRLELDHGRLLTTMREEVLGSAPAARVDRVIVVGGVHVTTPALAFLLDRRIDLIFLTVGGQVRGRLDTGSSGALEVRRAQYARAADATFGLDLARAIVAGKIANSRTRCMELDVDGDASAQVAIDRLARLRETVARAPDLSALMGVEGRAARHYFVVLGSALRPPWRFERRARRPPPDPVNAVLSIVYTLLQEQCRAALVAVGLDPECGFLHAPRSGRPALALDLMEEFRPVIADTVAWTLFNRRMLKHAHFVSSPDGRGVHLTPDGWKKVAAEYARRLNTGILIPGRTTRTTYRKLLEVQAWRIRRAIEGQEERYEPFLSR